NGIYRLDKHEVFWKLGTIPPKSSGILTAKVLLQWGLPHVMISNIALIATNSDEVDKYLYPDKIPNLDVAAYLEYLTMITHIELTHEEFENEVLSDQQFSETFNQIIKEGYYYTDVAVRTIMDNGTIVNVALLYKNNPLELLFINQYEKEKPIIMKMGVNTISFGEKEGGVTFDFPDSNKFEISCYGNWCGELNTSNKSPDGCTTSDCVNNGLIAKLPMYIVQKVSKIISLGMDVYECIKCGQSDPPDVFNCAKCAKFVQDNLADKIPWLGEIIDLTEVITNCIKDKNKYSVPDRTIKRECKQAPEDAWKRISESNDIREWIRMPKPGKYYVAQYLFTASTCRWDLEPYADAITECKSMKNVSEICQDGNCKENLKNLDVYGLEIITAGDPNAKYGPSGAVSAGQKLDYKVEFENEGEGIAFGVYFTDTLDEDLDDSTLVIGPVKDVKTDDVIAPEGTYNPKTHTITWMVGEVGSMKGGYAEISVNVKTDAPKGTEIINYGTVYFPSVPQVTRTNAIVSKIPDKEICGNGIDDDGDGLIDCDDPDCFSQNCQEICDDGLDNDGDGFVDCADTDCEPCREICNNGLDDDRDGLVDCDDPDCTVICNCKPEQVTVKPIRLKLRKKASDELTITVRGENDCPVVGQKVITKISKAGTSRITVVPVDTVTDNNGESKFTVTALKKTGSARIFFKIGGLRISIPVKVVK
ncbi:MAG: Ig-like domain-containing protein, partial [Candidatus Brocadiaceae bacterium]